jgi:transposase
MAAKTQDTKRKALQRGGNVNLRRGPITHPLFQASDFFDSDDMIQVKYEMLRQVRVERKPVSQAAKAFGFSRPSFYQAQVAFEQKGLSGLLPQKRGPRDGHKLTRDIIEFLQQARAADSSLKSEDLVQMVKSQFGVLVHRRSIERQLSRRKKA